MKRKKQSKIKKTLTILILLGIFITLAFSLRLIRIQVSSDTSESVVEVDPSNYIEITSASTFETIQSNEKKSLIMFTSNWCGSCSQMITKLKFLATQYPDINFYFTDIEMFRDNAAEYNVAITPALVLIEKSNFSTFQEIRPEILETTVEEFVLLGI